MTDIQNIICNWCTYNGTHCRRNILIDSKSKIKFCAMHKQLYNIYSLPVSDMCETEKYVTIIPRSYKHVHLIMRDLGYEDDIVDVKITGGSIEEANISNEDYILLLSDDTKYFYNQTSKNKALDLRIKLRKYCDKKSLIRYNDVNYCEECYKQLKNVLKLSIALQYI